MLTAKQRKYLMSKAHPLKAIVQIGKSGLTDESISSINHALDHHELIKVKFIAFKTEKEALREEIVEKTGAEGVGMIGHVLSLYKPHEKADERKYKLPE